jgi:hypothetical protein
MNRSALTLLLLLSVAAAGIADIALVDTNVDYTKTMSTAPSSAFLQAAGPMQTLTDITVYNTNVDYTKTPSAAPTASFLLAAGPSQYLTGITTYGTNVDYEKQVAPTTSCFLDAACVDTTVTILVPPDVTVSVDGVPGATTTPGVHDVLLTSSQAGCSFGMNFIDAVLSAPGDVQTIGLTDLGSGAGKTACKLEPQYGFAYDHVTISTLGGFSFDLEYGDPILIFDDDIPPGAVEDCTNAIDDDGDTLIDCADPDCAADPACGGGGPGGTTGGRVYSAAAFDVVSILVFMALGAMIAVFLMRAEELRKKR